MPGKMQYATLPEKSIQKKSVRLMNRIKKEYHLDKDKDSETPDILYGTVAVNFALQHKYKKFEKYIGLMRNKFNETSFMNMAASKMLNDINGNTVNLADFADSIVLLDLWATWCSPCIASFPAIQVMIKKHPEVVFLFIVVEEKGKDPLTRVKFFIENKNYPFMVLMDEPIAPDVLQYKIIAVYKPNGIPAKYIIDKKGILRFRTSGFDTDAALMNELEATFTILHSL
jgi:thiol-disulfide isomerase/thioredoxin